MKEVLVTITERGQLTLPAEVRRLLGVKRRGKITFVIDDGEVRVTPARFTLESAYGSVRPRQHPEDFEQIIAEAMEQHARDLAGGR